MLRLTDLAIKYTDETALMLAEALLHNSSADTKIAVVSAPSVFIQLKNLMVCCKSLCCWARLAIAYMFIIEIYRSRATTRDTTTRV